MRAGTCPFSTPSSPFSTTSGLDNLQPVGPVVWRPAEPLGYWSVTRYADVDYVMRDTATFTSERGTMLCLLGQEDPAAGRQMAATDPPRHRQLREPLQHALNAKPTGERREQFREAVIDVLAPLADGVYDLADHMAMLPMAVVGGMMALPPADWPDLVAATKAAVAPEDPACGRGGSASDALKRAHRELFAYFLDMVVARRRHPGDDLISLLLAMQMDGRPLSSGEIVSNCYSLLLGANVTTAHVLPSTLLELMGTPVLEQWADTSSPRLLATGVEEALRWSSPGAHFLRHATGDAEVGGQPVRRGDPVVVWLGSANRDSDVFAEPFTFDPGRRPNKHLTFGIGPHYCVGHSVARVTLRLLFAELFSRYCDFKPAGEAIRMRSDIVTGWTSMPITARLRPHHRQPAY
jgi:cytochrome P450